MKSRFVLISVAALLVASLSLAVHSQSEAGKEAKLHLERCASICLSVEDADLATKLSSPYWHQVVKTRAVLVNNTKYEIKVKASGDNWLFYDVMSDIDTVKKRYSCHVCYYRTVKPKSVVRFEVYAGDIKDIFAIRIRYHYAWENEVSDELIHFVSWLKVN